MCAPCRRSRRASRRRAARSRARRSTCYSAPMRIALAQLNPVIGDFRGNAKQILGAWKRAKGAGAELVVTPELSLVGYPPKDLLEKKSFIDQNLETLADLAACTREGPGLVVGFADRN